jgi:hypothetical protein
MELGLDVSDTLAWPRSFRRVAPMSVTNTIQMTELIIAHFAESVQSFRGIRARRVGGRVATDA